MRLILRALRRIENKVTATQTDIAAIAADVTAIQVDVAAALAGAGNTLDLTPITDAVASLRAIVPVPAPPVAAAATDATATTDEAPPAPSTALM